MIHLFRAPFRFVFFTEIVYLVFVMALSLRMGAIGVEDAPVRRKDEQR
jgi:hypothetical protein